MPFNTLYSENFYCFINNINNLCKKNILKFQNISLVYLNDQKKINNNFIEIKKFCKKNKIKLYILNDFKIAFEHNLNGTVFTKKARLNYIINKSSLKKNFKLIAIIHNQKEYMQNKLLGYSEFFLSPLFKNEKYSENNFFGTNKFRLISLNWGKKIFALGGINLSNFSKIKLLNCSGIGFVKFINEIKIKKPTLLKRGWV